jgi:hypothetical protein
MSLVKVQGNASGTGIFTIASPNSNTDRTLTLPDNTGTILTTATAGVPVNGPAFRAYLPSGQTVSAAVNTKVQLSVEVFDTAGAFDSTTNYRFTPQVAGYYQFNVTLGAAGTGSLTYNWIQIYKNGTADSISIYGPYSGTSNYGNLSTLIYLNGSTDYVELYVQLGGTGTLTVVGGAGAISTYMSGFLARSAT